MEGGEDDSTTRIYVGGLGESVTSDDLCTIFSKIGGDIKAVDIIRTKGRSFAYIDFSPSSHNSLSKLFSTYNGCVWKGKRLRLEKAKEHYLDRLKQEWAEDAQLASSTYTAAADDDTDKNMESFKKPMKELSSEKKQLRIFFPRLQKLKSLPFSGTGKHRYSFRRVEVPPLPTHFCDCEEHSGSVYTTEKKAIPVLEEQGGGMSKEELDMMNSVMNKLFEIENVSATAHSDIVLTKEQESSIKVSDDFQSEENEGYSTEDDDNLIINVVQRRKETAFTDQESKLNKGQASKDGPTQDVLKSQTRRHDDGNRKGSVSAVSEGNGSFQSNLNEPGNILEAKLIEPESIAKQSDPKLSWSQKSSWRELIGNKSSSAMNISDILPGISSNKEEKSKSDSITNSKNSKNKKLSRRENQKGQTNKPEVLDKIEVEVPAETKPAKQDSDCMPNSKNEKLLRHENQRGQTDEQEVLDKIEGPAETQPSKQDSDSIANSKNKKLLRHENQGGQTDKPAVLDKIEVEGTAETQPTKQDSDSTPNSKNSKNNKLLRHENQRGQTENQGVLDKIELEGPAETQPTKQD
ncbi:nucleolar protein 8 [Jatropha curcas]|nr:nucleolar protein 8 [Jatropha curcas]